MHELVFYIQKRQDGGSRTGIELDGDTIFGRFEGGVDSEDPTLSWYIDLRCDGEGLPCSPEAARNWLLEHEEEIRAGLLACSKELKAGRDVEAYPLLWDRFPSSPTDVSMKIACATKGRVWAIAIPLLLEEVALKWRDRIESLHPVEWAT